MWNCTLENRVGTAQLQERKCCNFHAIFFLLLEILYDLCNQSINKCMNCFFHAYVLGSAKSHPKVSQSVLHNHEKTNRNLQQAKCDSWSAPTTTFFLHFLGGQTWKCLLYTAVEAVLSVEDSWLLFDCELNEETEWGSEQESTSLSSQHIPGPPLFLNTSYPRAASHTGQIGQVCLWLSCGLAAAFTLHDVI